MNDITTEVQLSEEQELAAQAFDRWLNDFRNAHRPYFVIEGYAGTGKSFCVSTLVKRHGLNPHYMTYTGKAALVLNKYSKVDATTIHSAIYRAKVVSDETFKQLYKQMEEATDSATAKEIKNQIEELKRPRFELNRDALEDVELIVLDECSMVDDEILGDLLTFDIPLIALGDPGQLPPVKGEGALFKGMADARLTQIRRQALDSPIIQWSMWARTQRTLPGTYPDEIMDHAAAKAPANVFSPEEQQKLMDQHDITICWKNATRRNLNYSRRMHLGYTGIYPNVGETLIFTKNDRVAGVLNGLFGTVVEVGDLYDTYIDLKVKLETQGPDDQPMQVKVMRACFEEYIDPNIWDRVKPWEYKGKQQADFGYAITCHKAQGSQWDRVLVFEENVFNWFKPGIQEQRAQWLYTAITRAAKKVTLLTGKV